MSKIIIVKKCGIYKDGGTVEYSDNKSKKYFVDNRIGTRTKGKIFDRYPGDEGALILDVILTERIS